MANSTSSANQARIRQALEHARDCEDGNIDRQTSDILEAAITDLWRRVQNQPDSYVLSRDEFALFNYFLRRFNGSPVARRAVERFWNNYQGTGSSVDGSKT
ncbi:hypothetical protein N8T08_000243 [Aspergillus melleus]|uniref:Uncharacterized protein n=1 Tax=Aspergillus melleus TaxID=138277 RepID=A0ACC3BHD0_9EURO|nr:uncharacterized protein LDX57_003428 [Aspergillus melleus]KAH8425679.1 hypothetical protein LDX57_003428 [Aspergillus melleus]KAK1150341.1 hypothetical protein N8T08_000243 [Aspergillus melleus]